MINSGDIRIWKEVDVVYCEVLSRHISVQNDKIDEDPTTILTVLLRFEHETSQLALNV
jgi:hypothetical protein